MFLRLLLHTKRLKTITSYTYLMIYLPNTFDYSEIYIDSQLTTNLLTQKSCQLIKLVSPKTNKIIL